MNHRQPGEWLEATDTDDGDNFRHELGQELRQARRNAHMTLKQAAAAIDASISGLSDIERGVSAPSVWRLYRLERCYGIEAGTILSAIASGRRKNSLSIALRKVLLERLGWGDWWISGNGELFGTPPCEDAMGIEAERHPAPNLRQSLAEYRAIFSSEMENGL